MKIFLKDYSHCLLSNNRKIMQIIFNDPSIIIIQPTVKESYPVGFLGMLR